MLKSIKRLWLVIILIPGMILLSSGISLAQTEDKLTWQSGVTVTTTYGRIKGFESSPETFGWKAIPFAKPPVGELRWKAPLDPEPWGEIREANEFCDKCTQYSFFGGIEGKEDCLYLNIWRPNSKETGLPVYFWIHGGGNSIMTASSDSFDGVKLSKTANLVVVTTNYRLGPIGWFTHPVLRKGKDAKDDSGNYGTLDIIKALEWVRGNILAFGGDPDNITIAGESAGAVDVFTLLVSPLAANLFHRAIAQSGSPRMASMEEGEKHVNEVLERLLVNDGRAVDRETAKTIWEKMSVSEMESYLRSKTAEEILQGHRKSYGPMIRFPNCFTDGSVLPKAGADAFKNNDTYNQMPIILGTNKEEMKLFMRPSFNSLTPEEYQKRAIDSSVQWQKRGVDDIAESITSFKSQPKVYAYQFNYGAYNPEGYNAWTTDRQGVNYALMMGAAHGLEIPFFWGNFSFFGLDRMIFREDNKIGREALSAIMMQYVAQFTKTGNPGEAGGIKWEPWSNAEGEPKRILLDADSDKAILKMSNK